MIHARKKLDHKFESAVAFVEIDAKAFDEKRQHERERSEIEEVAAHESSMAARAYVRNGSKAATSS